MRFSILAICGALMGAATAQTQFSSPKGGVSNAFSQTWFEGDTMDIAWYGEWKGTGTGGDVVDLWITWYTNSKFSQLILPNITMGEDGNTTWKVNVTNAIAKEDKRFILRLKPHTSRPKYTDSINQALGVGINIEPNDSTTATKPKKKRIGPIVGGVLGGLLVLILLLVAVLILLRMKKKNNKKAKEAGELEEGQTMMAPEVKYFQDQSSGERGHDAPVEMADTHGTRPGQGGVPVELADTNGTKPGPGVSHELPAAPAEGGADWRR